MSRHRPPVPSSSSYGMRNLDGRMTERMTTDDGTDGWKGRQPPGQNQGYYISRLLVYL